MATVSYGFKIINANRIFDATLRIYRAAVSYLMDIADRHYEELLPITGYVNVRGKKVTAQQARQQYLERLVHATKDRPNVPYKNFDKDFYKFPSYLRRDAINTAIGNIMSYRSQVKNWKAEGCRGKRPFFVHNRSEMPCFLSLQHILSGWDDCVFKIIRWT